MWSGIIGGIGIFLFGMLLLSEGLQEIASDKVKKQLERATKNKFRGILMGTVMTTVLQSSSAAILITISLVNAGLLSFSQSLGVIFGTNLGTTFTAWLISLVGLKIQMTTYALPLLTLGTLLRLRSKTTWSYFGTSLIGFSFIFIGLQYLQDGMLLFSDKVDLESFGTFGISGRVLLVGIGVLMTIIMQSSTAAVATTLTALHAGAIDLEQGAALVIGQNIGTSFKALLGAIGANAPAKRTALAHVTFNVITGAVAFAFLPLFTWAVSSFSLAFFEGQKAITLSAFHTVFNLVGVLVCVPLSGKMSSWITRKIPENRPPLLRHLDSKNISGPRVALESVRLTLIRVSTEVIRHEKYYYQRNGSTDPTAIKEIEIAMENVFTFFSSFSLNPNSPEQYEISESLLHVLDHTRTFVNHMKESSSAAGIQKSTELKTLASTYEKLLQDAEHFLLLEQESPIEPLANFHHDAKEKISHYRRLLLAEAAQGKWSPMEVDQVIQFARRLESNSYSLARVLFYLQKAEALSKDKTPSTDPDATPESNQLETIVEAHTS
jgi:phosphate:Na+ symporter